MWEDISNTVGGFWDSVTNSFKTWIDYDLKKAEVKAQTQQLSSQQSPAYQAAAAWEGQTSVAGINVPNILLYAGLGVAAVVVLKKAKVI